CTSFELVFGRCIFSFLPCRIWWCGLELEGLFKVSKRDFRRFSVILLSSLKTALTMSVVFVATLLCFSSLSFFFGLLKSHKKMSFLGYP
ncbi:MAG: hypothetical protein ACK4F9_03355, partial [Brevinematia bacterium]